MQLMRNESAIGLSLLCSLPVHVAELALIGKDKEVALILAKALGFSWQTTMSLLFLGAPGHRIQAQDLEKLKQEFEELNRNTSRSVLEAYQARRQATDSGLRRLPQLQGM